ncbi:MAG: beta-propeller domain-containing protein, partial [Actinomycetota bacterium]|nr:beta-propeller domain-containing protein [Actinomycetota bacterium]
MTKKLFAVLMATIIVATACTGESDGAEPRTIDIGRPGESTTLIASLQAFEECDDFLSHLQENALEMVGPWGLDQHGFGGPAVALEGGIAVDTAVEESRQVAISDSAAGDAVSHAASAPVAGEDFSTTNVQEVGVDEPDLVKTDGRRILAIAQNQLHLVILEDGTPHLVDSIDLPRDTWVQEMLFDGDRVLLLAGGNGGAGTPIAAARSSLPGQGWWQISVLVQVDIDGEDLEITRKLSLDGYQLSARVVGGVARVVVQSSPTGLVFEYPEGGGLRAERDAERANRRIIEQSSIDNWLPYFVLEDGRGRVIDEGTLVDCENTYHPDDFSGLNMLNVVTIDLAGEGLSAPDAVSVLADGQIVYASTGSLYVATTRWIPWWRIDDAVNSGEDVEVPEISTGIHKFDITDPTTSAYVASGEVPGSVLNQYSLSEHDGFIRIATTKESLWWEQRQESSSSLFVLEPDGGELKIVGEVNDLGRGERIFAVRYLGDLATVVTFRQTDPLYTIDLADPTNPAVLGELKINGYSAYLHPIGDDLLIGVGQDATDEGRTTGTQVSLFDISDRENPIRVDQWTLRGAYSDTEWDARAFLWWEQTGLAVIPVNSWGWNKEEGRDEAFFGAIGLHIADGQITEVGRVSHQQPRFVRECWSPDGEEPTAENIPKPVDGDMSASDEQPDVDVLLPEDECYEYWDAD